MRGRERWERCPSDGITFFSWVLRSSSSFLLPDVRGLGSRSAAGWIGRPLTEMYLTGAGLLRF